MKKILVLFLILFAVQVQAAGIYTTVASGTVASADIAVTLTAGSANVDLSSATIPRNYKGHLIRIYDANNVMIQGYVYTDGAGTVQNIVNTKGGTTRNWASQGAGFDDTTNCRYEIIKVRQAVSIAGGAVTAANERLSLVNGTAFYFGSIDCRAGGYHDGRHWARFQDSSGYVAFAKIKAEEPAGEALGSETNSTANASSDPNGNEANATTTWLSDGATITSDGSVKTTGSYSIKADFSAGGNYVTTVSGFIPIVGALYKIVADLKTENNARVITVDGTGTIIRTVLSATSDWVTKTEYITNKAGTNPYLGYYGGKAFAGQQGIVYIDNYSRKQVTVPPATGALLENMAGTRNMIYAHPSFNPNAIANIQILYVGD